MVASETQEILIPHDLNRGPITTVRRLLVHSSIAEIKQLGLYEHYREHIAPASLTRILELIGPGSMPVELALEHYRACDKLEISDRETQAVGKRAGERMQGLLLVTQKGAETAPWSMLGAVSRVGERLYDGGSSQYVRLGPKRLSIERMGNPFFSVRYFRIAHKGFLREMFGRLGLRKVEAQLSEYHSDKARILIELTWQ
ncbi:MAG: hypothetical protein OXR73_02990 [Myxococcales bacterium]|nr:hypothetical protein [Myxococcales bacterium]